MSDIPRSLWSVREFAESFGINPTTVYDLANRGELGLVKLGRRTFVTEAERVRFLDALPRGVARRYADPARAGRAQRRAQA